MQTSIRRSGASRAGFTIAARTLCVPSPRPAAPLAIDPFRKLARIKCAAVPFGGARIHVRISVVTEHAAIRNLAAECLVSGPLVPRTHSPMPAGLRIPTHGELHQLLVRG